MLPDGDRELVKIMDAALADAAVRSGHWLACRPGCDQCCSGVFRIAPLDTERLREGLKSLTRSNPEKAAVLRARVRESVARLSADFPGDSETGIIFEDEDSLERFEDFANDEVCPVLDPATGTCDLYAYRPMTCRTFGPPVQTADGVYGVCELCFVGAPKEAVAAAELHLPDPLLESALDDEIGLAGTTIVAFALTEKQDSEQH
ncbi:YkgJ family cysteine cluster protein [Terriglobus roseus]|uniref:Putative zinc-or iron-chelating domain-containing protein n=1 Tax=Terriglobus roseus TaxID=392734 RepID=A0A1H4U6K7_9BACT|nr:YkgJ family cysteine cluster protein [Terriglobus roseus]SEC64366.1 Putative zinc-or iron-chelating domain-containing protein [Terriglobus roseus]